MNTNFYLDLIKSFKIISRETWSQIGKNKELIHMKKSLSLENLEFGNFLQVIAKNICYTLRKYPDSPVFYIIFQNNSTICCKVSFCEIDHLNFRRACLMDEIYNLKMLHKKFQDNNNCWVSVFQQSIDLNTCETLWAEETFTFSFTKYIPPFQHPKKPNVQCQNLREYAIESSDMAFRTAVFQVLATLLKLQTVFPGYRHNDLKCDNILVTNTENTEHTEKFRIYEMKTENGARQFKIPMYVQCILIDFESSWWTERTNQYESLPCLIEIKNRFGIYEFPCAAFDVHLFCMDLLRTLKHNLVLNENSEIYKNFYLFLMDFFVEDFFKLEHLQEFRLLEKHQKTLHINIQDMLLHPYFFGYRYVSHEESQKNIFYIS